MKWQWVQTFFLAWLWVVWMNDVYTEQDRIEQNCIVQTYIPANKLPPDGFVENFQGYITCWKDAGVNLEIFDE